MSRPILPLLLLSTCLASIAPAGHASAADAATKPQPAAMPTPPPEVKQLDFFVGSWTCHGQVAASEMAPAHPNQTTVKIVSDLGGFWLTGRLEEQKSADNPHPLSGAILQGYDTATKQLVMRFADNMGSLGDQTSPGWDGDKIVFAGGMSGMGSKIQARDTFTRKGKDELHHVGEIQPDGTAWVQVVEETCKRAK